MVSLTEAGFLAAAVAAATELLVLGPSEHEPTTSERDLRLVAAAMIGGLATLGLVIGILSITLHPAAEPSSVVAAVSATAIVAGALGVALSWRGRPTQDRPRDEPAERSLLLFRYVAFETIGVLGFLLGVVPLFFR